jgi:hypothetical protein
MSGVFAEMQILFEILPVLAAFPQGYSDTKP